MVGLGAVLAAVVVGYAFFQPFIPGAVCGAIPAQASFVHRFDDLKQLQGSPVYELLDKIPAASSLWLRRVVPSEVAVADLPLRYPGQTKAWAAVSWVGWRSPWLRWRLEHTRAEGFSFLGKHNVWPIWKYETTDIEGGASLVFSLTDNLFIACLSENPEDILLLLETYDRRAPSVNDLK